MLYVIKEGDHDIYNKMNMIKFPSALNVPYIWFTKLLDDKDKPFLEACVVLSHIVDQYTPIVHHNKKGIIELRKKFSTERYIVNVLDLVENFSIGKTKTHQAIKYLGESGVLNVDKKSSNDYWVTIDVDELIQLTFEYDYKVVKKKKVKPVREHHPDSHIIVEIIKELNPDIKGKEHLERQELNRILKAGYHTKEDIIGTIRFYQHDPFVIKNVAITARFIGGKISLWKRNGCPKPNIENEDNIDDFINNL